MEFKLLTADRFVDKEMGCSYRYVVSDTEYFRPHYHDYAEIFIVLDGQAYHIVNGMSILLEPRDMVFVRPSDMHDYIIAEGKFFSMLNITFTLDTLEKIFSYLGNGFPSSELNSAKLPPCVRLNTGEFSAIMDMMTSIGAIQADHKEKLKTSLRILLFDIFTKFFSDFLINKDKIPMWLEVLCSEIRKNGGFVEGSKRFFSMTDKSREHVCRCMKKYMGVSVSEFINELRLNYICNMLTNSNHSVTDIIYESGFNNLSWAAELFKKRYGITMGEYRKRVLLSKSENEIISDRK